MAENTTVTRKGTLHKLELLRAYWPEDDRRVNEGAIFEVEADEAIRLIEEGVAKRADKNATVTVEADFSRA